MVDFKLLLRRVFYSDGMNTLPAKVMTCVFMCLLFNAMTQNIVFSLAPKLVQSFGYTEEKAGYYVGIIASVFYPGAMLFSIFWGYVADTIGKKKTTLVAGALLTTATAAFGFSFNLAWAICFRFFQGCSFGLYPILKAVTTDVCDNTNQALGMSIVMGALDTGIILGPSLGGFLGFPNKSNPDVFGTDSIFTRFGMLLPILILVLGLAATVSGVAIFLPNDNRKETREENSALLSSKERNANYTIDISTEHGCPECEENLPLSAQSTSEVKEKPTESNDVEIHFQDTPKKRSKIVEIFRTKECVIASLSYGLFSMVGVGFDELFPLYAQSSRHYGGYGFSTPDVGTSLLIASVVVLFVVFFIIPRVTQYFGPRKLYLYSGLFQAVFFPLIPLCARLQGTQVFWPLMLIILCIIRVGITLSYISTNMLVNNSVEPRLLGSANGLGMTCACTGRVITTQLMGTLFSWSLTNEKSVLKNTHPLGFPFNVYFPFFVLLLICGGSAFIALLLPNSINHKKLAGAAQEHTVAYVRMKDNDQKSKHKTHVYKVI